MPIDGTSLGMAGLQRPTIGISDTIPLRAPGAAGATPKFSIPDNFQTSNNIAQLPATGESMRAPSIQGPTTFGHLMHQVVLDVNKTQQVAGEKVRDVLMGGPTPVHEAMIAVEESSVAFQMLAEMRNKLVDSYQEIMRMPV